MSLLKSLVLRSKFILGMNFCLIGFLLLTILFTFRAQGDRSVVGKVLQGQARSAVALFALELDKARLDTKSMADLTSHIFSHPESYRLSAQPGEYDYDEKIGIYGSIRNDGTTVAFLSTRTPLTPNLLKEIRLSEYLNPIFESHLNSSSVYHQVSLITIDSFQRSYPWFDFKGHITRGIVRKDFESSSFPFFNRAKPENNPQHDAICDVFPGESSQNGSRILCVAPFFVGEQFHGTIVTEVNPAEVSKRIFMDSDLQNRYAMLAGNDGRVLGMSMLLGGVDSKKQAELMPRSVSDLKFQYFPDLDSLLKKLPIHENFFGHLSGGYVQVIPLSMIPARVVVLTTLAEAENVSVGGSAASPFFNRRWASWIAVIGGILLFINSLWILEQRKRALGGAEESISILPATSVHPFASSAENQSKEKKSGADQSPMFPEDDHPPRSPGTSVGETQGLLPLTCQVRVLSCFDATDPVGMNLPKLCEILQQIFSVRQAVILIYSPDEKLFRLLWENAAVRGEGLELQPFEIKAESFLDLSADLREVLYSNTPESPGGARSEIRIVKQNYLFSPVSFHGKLFGGVLLADKTGDFSAADQSLLQALQESIALTLRNLYQCEGLLKIDELRREYCIELARAVETMLDRIRGEVQAIYTRMGRASSPHKKNCEAILFEVGKLSEVVKEFEPSNEASPPLAATETMNHSTRESEHM